MFLGLLYQLIYFREYLYLVELQKRPEHDLAEILRTKSDRVLSLKCLHNAEFSDLQNNILNILSRDSRPLNIETVSSESFTNILKTRNEFLPLVISQISSTVNESESEESIERASDLLCAIIVNCDKNISESILNGVESSIENEFCRGLLLNSLIVKICN